MAGAIDGPYGGLVFDNTLDQAVIMPSQGRQPLGFVYATKYDPSNGTAEFGLVADPENPGSGLVLHGAMLFLDRLFRQFSLRKLASELVEFNRGPVANGEGAEDFGGVFSFETKVRQLLLPEGSLLGPVPPGDLPGQSGPRTVTRSS